MFRFNIETAIFLSSVKQKALKLIVVVAKTKTVLTSKLSSMRAT